MNNTDYKKKYKDLLEQVRKIHALTKSDQDKGLLEKIFPELQEKEDERIKKNCIHFLELQKQHHAATFEIEECIDWLKKQNGTTISINWHDVSEKPEKNREVLCEWVGSNNCIWHDVTFYNPTNEAFWNCGRQVDYVTRWCYVDDIEKQNKQKESPCDRCKKEQPSHSCQDITALGRCYLEHEKQGEQKPTDRVEPKFHEGDWVVSPNGVYWHIDAIRDGRYQVSSDSGDSADWPLDTNIYHRFNIQDAKDGDILASDNGVIILVKESRNSLWGYRLCYHCAVLYDGTFEHREFHVNPEKFFPATKEQRELLFKEMKKNGYEWDSENKQLKIVDDKTYNDEDYGSDGLYYALDILERTLGKVTGYQSDDGIIDHKCAINTIKKLYNQKTTWSEKDEECYNSIIEHLKYSITNGKPETYTSGRLTDWLQSLKDRVRLKRQVKGE